MASGSESGGKKLAPKWVMGPKEDVVHVLMETLVDPLLPLGVSKVTPSEDSQKSAAKQMHAVVLLYNYYYRKQEPEQLFIDFVLFCKLAVVIRPPLTSFMKMVMESEPMELNCAENQLMLTEKAIMDACDIAAALDESKDVLKVEQWPISKVVVLLIDSKKENCMLHFGAVTQGVWSPIEKELIDSSINLDISAGEQVGDKRKRNNQKLSTYDDDKFLQLGYDAVKHIAGIDSSELEVLETHVTYSLSKEKSAARLYMMQFSGSFSVQNQVPLKFLVESLQGPLAEKSEYGSWRTTAVVEYFHMLPYVELISSWLSKKDLCLPSSSGCNAQSTTNNREKELTQSTTPASHVSKHNINDLDHIDKSTSQMKVNSSDKIAKENDDSNIKKSQHSSPGKSASPFDVFRKKKANDSNNSSSGIVKDLSNDNKQHEKSSLSGPSRSPSQRTMNENIATVKFNKQSSVSDSAIKEVNRSNLEISNTENIDQPKGSLSGSSKGLVSNKAVIDLKKSNTKYDTPMQNDADVREDADMNVDSVEFLKSDHTKRRDEGDLTNSRNPNGVVAKGNQPVPFEAKTKYNVEEISASEEMQNALALLYGKRQELYFQLCDMEDAVASYEDNIARIRDDGDVGLARQCIKSILSGNYLQLLERGIRIPRIQDKGHRSGQDNRKAQHEKPTELSETIYLPGKSSCQDLEYICLKNNWRLPRYFLEPSGGTFVSEVCIEGKDLKLSSKGRIESRPYEARESAAAQMMAKIQSIVYDRAD